MLQVTPVRAFTDNYIWLIHSPRDASRVLVVDPGDAKPVGRMLAERHLTLAGILITHHHSDHVGGVAELLRNRDSSAAIPVYGPANETIPGDPTRLREGDHARFAELGLEFAVLDVPGHTAGHIAYVGHGAVFCGDTLFSAGCGRLFEGTAEQMHSSLSKLAALPAETLVYCAHEYTLSNLKFGLAVAPGNQAAASYFEKCQQLRARDQATIPSDIRQERNVNPFLRCDDETVKQAAEAYAGRRLPSQPEVFAAIRQWKDGFR
ncbi:hydroxyacylglutathione hydrolase [Steroidobacter sp.]|uniref:hydroxyacylglutathione hydrolase n=1 Tax=Steroidobacter sp. TaxID=1978227 RepID=UPI001A56E9BD|nr:hydroxyacylglutathione hydrolase [Steroidobacter sp.]MBL8268503.1 hydroxyacylglutathione hydrolase [Steroidobacter sp.]